MFHLPVRIKIVLTFTNQSSLFGQCPWQTVETNKVEKRPSSDNNENKWLYFSLDLFVIVTFLLIVQHYCVVVVPKSKDNSNDDDEKSGENENMKETTTGDKQQWRQNVSDSKYVSAITSQRRSSTLNLQRAFFSIASFHLSRARARAPANERILIVRARIRSFLDIINW